MQTRTIRFDLSRLRRLRLTLLPWHMNARHIVNLRQCWLVILLKGPDCVWRSASAQCTHHNNGDLNTFEHNLSSPNGSLLNSAFSQNLFSRLMEELGPTERLIMAWLNGPEQHVTRFTLKWLRCSRRTVHHRAAWAWNSRRKYFLGFLK